MIRHTELDFGITDLASRFFEGWAADFESAQELVREYVFEAGCLAGVMTLVEDVARLVASNDPRTLSDLWESLTHAHHRVVWEGVDGLQWMREIAQICDTRLRDSRIEVYLSSTRSTYYAFRHEVMHEIEVIHAPLRQLVDEHTWAAAPGALDALRSCALNICPELAFRMLIRVLIQYRCDIDLPQYLRFVELGKKFSYGEFVVSRAEFLVR